MWAAFRGKSSLFSLDTSHAGAVADSRVRNNPPDMDKVVYDFSAGESSVVVYAASSESELARDEAKWGHGAFTQSAASEGIGEGKATFGERRQITTDMLEFYLSERVKELTDGNQHPVMNRPSLVTDFPLFLAPP